MCVVLLVALITLVAVAAALVLFPDFPFLITNLERFVVRRRYFLFLHFTLKSLGWEGWSQVSVSIAER